MASEKPDLEGFIAIIDAKIASLQRLRENLIASASLFATDFDLGTVPPGGSSPASVGPQGGATSAGPVELPTGVFRGKGLADSLRLYMSLAKRKQTFKEIKAALMEGGLATTSEFFEQTLNATLHRMKKSGELLQFKDGWDLAESYPAGFRQRLEESKDDSPRKKRRPKKKPARAEKPQPKASGAKKAEKPEPGREPVLRAV